MKEVSSMVLFTSPILKNSMKQVGVNQTKLAIEWSILIIIEKTRELISKKKA